MKETAAGTGGVVAVALPGDAVERFRETQRAIVARSIIVWGEHCTECAFPACYSYCNYYAPRLDHHCRRFQNGIERASAGVALKRVQFRRWGKLEGKGRIALHPRKRAGAAEAADAVADGVLATVPAALRDKLSWRLNAAKSALGGSGGMLQATDMFVLEAWVDGREAVAFTLSIMTSIKQAAGMYQAPARLEPGYNRLLFPVAEIAKLVDLDAAVVIQIEPLQDGTPPILFGALDFCRFAQRLATLPGRAAEAAAAKELPKLKCVVWDLDNTLWRGTLVEDGVEGVSLFEEAAAVVRELDRRGIINSIASKNDPELAFAALERFGLRELFVFPKIGWGPKSEAIKSIVAEMDVGVDTFAFIDDQPFERGEIKELVPGITVFAETEIAALLRHPRCDVPITPESSKRREMYQSEERRIIARDNSQLDYAAFLRSCDIRLDVARLQPRNLLRMYELSQRTNQLNFSGRRYSQKEVEALMKQRVEDTFVLTCSDKFGEYGAIGFCVLMEGRPAIESFFMSCRVQRKRVENAFFQLLKQELLARGAKRFEVKYKPTSKNKASVQMLEELGFGHESDDEGNEWFVRPLETDFVESDVVTLDLQFDSAVMELAL